ncbi:MAG: hypothetical protein E6G56_08680 [Actinobacteria bacterium]|nr:MAG: hypothetical protein E6G56_08680 [Actinomycetota bacterium]
MPSLGLVRQIDEQLRALDERLQGYEGLVAERRRLEAARAALTGDVVKRHPRLSQDEVAAFLVEHPGSRAGDIARALDAPLVNISQHLHRGKRTRFERREDGWHLLPGGEPEAGEDA